MSDDGAAEESAQNEVEQPIVGEALPTGAPAMSRRGNGDIFLFSSLLLVAIVGGVFMQVRRFEYVWDDGPNVFGNPNLTPVTAEGMKLIWTKPYIGLYIPLTYSLFALEAQFAGPLVDEEGRPKPLSPEVFHTGNLILHCGCAVLVYLLLWDLIGHGWSAFFGALLFGLHPLQVESVAWVTEQKGLLCAFFSLLAIWQYLASAGLGLPEESRPEGRAWWRFALATLFLLLALLAKPTAVVVPLVAGLLEVGVLGRPVKSAALGIGLWALPAAGVFIWTKGLQPDDTIRNVTSIWSRPVIAGDAMAFYLVKLFAPVWLGPDYGRTPQWVLEQGWTYIAGLLPLFVMITLACLPDRRIWLTALAVFYAWTLPVLGFVPFGFQDISTVADRYVYLGMLGPALAFSWLLFRFWGPAAIVAATLVVGFAGWGSFEQSKHWGDMEKLFVQGAKINPHSSVAYHNLGAIYAQNGRTEEAITNFRETLRLRPFNIIAIRDLVTALLQSKKTDEAIETARKAVEDFPERQELRAMLGLALMEKGMYGEAEKEYRAALESKPDEAIAKSGLGIVLYKRGRLDEAEEQLIRAIELDPKSTPSHYNLGCIAAAKGNSRLAADRFRACLALDPKLSTAETALAWILATDPDPSVRNGEEALKLAADANERTEGKNPFALDSLAAAQAENGHFDEAVRSIEAALKLLTEQDVRRPAMQTRLRFYLAKRPFRQSLLPQSIPSKES